MNVPRWPVLCFTAKIGRENVKNSLLFWRLIVAIFFFISYNTRIEKLQAGSSRLRIR